MVKDHPTLPMPRYFVFLRPAMVFIQPKPSSMRLRMRSGQTDEAELGFHAWPFAIEHGIGIARRDVRLVAPPLTAEVDIPIAPTHG